MPSAETFAREIVASALQIPVAELPADAGIDTYDKWDSLNHLRIVEEVEKHLGRPLETEEMLTITSIETLAQLLGTGVA